MILDRTWNKHEQKLIISYIDKLGNRQFYEKYLHHIATYEYDDNGEFETWNGRRCNRVFKDTKDYTPTEFDILEYMYNMPQDLQDKMHAQVFPKLYTFDIETEVSDEFPDPELAKQRVTSISLVGPDMSCIVYGLNTMTQEQIKLFEQRYLDWINKNDFARSLLNADKPPRVLYKKFDTEEDMLTHFFTVIIKKIPVLAGWNAYNFDWRYLIKRCEVLFGRTQMYNMLRACSPTGETRKYSWEEAGNKKMSAPGPSHSVIIDYMEIVKQYDYVLRPYESYSLDWVASHAVDAHKIKYNGTLQQLYERDPEWYYYYNAIDSLLVLLIHYKLKSLESPCAVSSVTLVPLISAMGQVALTTANVFEEFYNDNKRVVYDYDAIDRYKVKYDGAFCGCVPGRYEWNVCDDFASLYPSQVQTCNFSFENIVENIVGPDSLGRYTKLPWTEQDLERFRKDKNYFVSLAGNVYRNDKDYAFKKMQRRIKKNRDYFKYTGQRIDSEFIVYIDSIINNTKSDIKFSEDINNILHDKFNIDSQEDIQTLDSVTLNKLREDVVDLRHEYSLLELAMKTLGNAAYGASANQYFYFYNMNVAADITGECRNLTKTMWHDLENFFHETLWERKDLWQQFDFKLDEAKHDWYRTQSISIYSDTDSVYTTYGTLFQCMTPEYQEKYKTDDAKINWILKFNKEFLDKQNNQWCDALYNPRHGHNIHEFELETISKSLIALKKKKYLKGYVYVKGKFYDKPKVSGTGIEIIKSTTPKLCREILTDLMNSLMFEYDEQNKQDYIMLFNQKLANYRREFYKAPLEDISQSVGVGDYNKYVIDDTDMLLFGKQCPVSVKAIARFNYLAHKNNEDNKKQYTGKIKYYNIAIGENTDYFGFPAGELPTWAPKMDKMTQWRKTVIEPINRFLEVIGIPKVNADTAQQISLFL